MDTLDTLRARECCCRQKAHPSPVLLRKGCNMYLRSRMYSATCSGEVSQSIVSTTFRLSLSPASCLRRMVSCLRSHCPCSRRSNTSSSSTSNTRSGNSSSYKRDIKLDLVHSTHGAHCPAPPLAFPPLERAEGAAGAETWGKR